MMCWLHCQWSCSFGWCLAESWAITG